MHIIKKLVKRLVLIGITCILLMIVNKEDVFAADVFLDSDNNFCVVTVDKLKTSDIYYKTFGFSISRCEYNPATKNLHASKEMADPIVFRFDANWNNLDSNPTPMAGMQINTFKVPLMTLISTGSGDWVKEVSDALMGGPPVYIKFDSIMGIFYGPQFQGKLYKNYPTENERNPAEIQAAEAWSNKAGLATHFNRYFLIGGNEKKEPEEIAGDTLIADEVTPLVYATENADDPEMNGVPYDLSQGIPSSKYLINKYRASSWYGGTQVYARVQPNSDYENIRYHYEGVIVEQKERYNSVTGKNETYEERTPVNKYGVYKEMKAWVSFQYLANADFYDLDITGVYNLAYEATQYYDSEIDIPMKAVSTKKFVDISNEEVGKEKIDSWYADSEKHILWAAVPPPVDKGLGEFRSHAEWETFVEKQILTDRDELQEKISTETKSWNDYLEIDHKIYLKGNKENLVAGCNFFTGKPSWSQCSKSAAVKNKFEVGSIRNAHTGEDMGEHTGIWIPSDTDNGQYPTGMEVVYSRLIKNDKYSKIFYAGNEWFSSREGCEDIYAHCDNAANEPINVHTPVIAPVVAKNADFEDITDETQLVSTLKNPDITYQFQLDNVYLMDWWEAEHRNITSYGASGHYSKYDEFVEKKWMKYPFDVEYDGVYYEKDTWIQIKRPDSWKDDPDVVKAAESNGWYPTSKNHWKITPVYIPSYAIECGGLGEPTAYCEYKVEALNVDGRYGGDHTAEQEEIYNKDYHYVYADDGAKYVATYRFPIQLSGIIYDFTITGTSDKDMFHNVDIEDKQVTQDIHFPFCTYKMEKKVGTKNRLGEIAMRFRTDGMLTRAWEAVNTLVLNKGKSNCWDNMGALWKGTEFSYSFKTIANLWSENTDTVEITPTFRYLRYNKTTGKYDSVSQYEYDSSGKVVKTNFKVYYHNPNETNLFVEYGTTRDKNNTNLVRLDHPEFNDSYYDVYNTYQRADGHYYQFGDWANYTVHKRNQWTSEGITIEEFMHRETPSYNLSSIKLDSNLRYLSGEYEQLQRNIRGQGHEYESILTYWDNAKELTNSDGSTTPGYNLAKEDRFRYSMQTWYGQYYVPANLFIVDLEKNSLDKDFDLQEYAKDGITEDDPIFEPNAGYLVINFDILTKNEGKAHLKYYGANSGGKDMWKEEGFDYTDDIDGKDIKLESGDVVVVDLGSSIEDKYTAGLFDIN